ncbi:MAG: fibronectin type III domain-containing protein, partial [Nitrospiria bacterium]
SSNTTLVTGHSRTLSGLSPSTTYHYRVISQDGSGNVATSVDNTFNTPPSTSLTITNLSAGSGKSYQVIKNGLSNGALVYIDRTYLYAGVPSFLNGATYIQTANDDKSAGGSSFVSFDVDQDAVVFIAFDDRITPKPSWLLSFIDIGLDVTINDKTHSLLSKTFPAGSISLGGNEGGVNRKMYTITVVGKGAGASDTTPPVISAATAVGMTEVGATINWSTNEAATSLVEYGPTTAYGSFSTTSTILVTSHSRSLGGLSAATTYHYRVVSSDAFGNKATSADGTFTTKALTDTNGPVISGISADAITQSAANISWVTDEPASARVEYGLTAAYGASTTLNATLLLKHTQAVTGLLPGTVYHYRVVSKDKSGNQSVSGDHSFVTSLVSDTTPPADIANFTATPGFRKIDLSWINPTDADFVGVRIRVRTDRFPTGIDDGELVGDVSGSPGNEMHLTHLNLSNGVTYFYLAASYDSSGNFQNTAFVSATPIGTATEDNGSSEVAAGGCGMIRPGSGNPPGPGDAAAMLSLFGLISLMWLKKVSRTISKHVVTKIGEISL